MMHKVLCTAAFALFALVTARAYAVEPTQPIIPLFNEDLMTNVAGINVAGNSGIAAPGTNEALYILDPNDPTKAKSRVKFRLRVKSSANNAQLGTFTAYVDTRAYPDPYTVGGTTYYCEDGGSESIVDPTSDFFPCDYDVNIGIANFGATRYLVMSLAVYAGYENAASGYVDIGQAAVWVWDPVTGAKLWNDSWAVIRGQLELADSLSAVGDFLDSDGSDEVRIAYWREGSNNKIIMEYTYYDIATGTEIPGSAQTFAVTSP